MRRGHAAFGEFLGAGESGSQGEERGEQVPVALVSNGEAAKAAKPGDGALDDPTVSAQPGRGLDATTRDVVADAPFAGSLRRGPRRERTFGIPWSSGSKACESCKFPPDAERERQSCPVGHDVDLRVGLAAIDRVWTGQRSPFFARRVAPSTIARDQSITPVAPSRSSTARWSFAHRPPRTIRQAAVRDLVRDTNDRDRQAQPVVRTNTIAQNTCRSSALGVPPPCARCGDAVPGRPPASGS